MQKKLTAKDRLDLMMSTEVGKVVTDEFKQYLISAGFFTAPASTKYHGAYNGGLFDHSFAVMGFLAELTAANKLRWSRPESPFIVGMFHDLCKIDQYRLNRNADWEYNDSNVVKGHGIKSVILLQKYIKLTDEEIACILYHMGAFTPKEEWNDYTNAIHKHTNVLWTHMADMLASHVAGI